MIVLKVLLVLLAVIALLLLIAAVRAIKIKAKPNDKQPAVSHTPEEEQKYAEILSSMIKVPTVSANEGDDLSQFDRLHEVMEESFPLVFEKLEKTEIDGNLLMRWKGKNSNVDGIMLMGHQDVVPAEDNGSWEKPPFSGEISDGRIHGRGAMDCKCTVMAEWQAVEELLEEGFVPERDVYLSCSVNEETSGGGAEKIIDYLQKNNIRLAAVMDEGGAIVNGFLPGMKTWVAAAGVVEKGTCNIKFTAKGSGGHSSTPTPGTPIARLSEFVCEAEKKNPFKTRFTQPVAEMFTALAPYLTFPFRLLLGNLWLFKPLLIFAMPKVSPMARAFLSTTCVFTMSGGSQAANVIPEEAYVIANIRPSIQQNKEESFEILKKMAAKYDIEAEMLIGKSASRITDSHSEEFEYVRKVVGDVFPQYCFAPYYMAGGTDCRKYESVSDNCIRFSPIRIFPDQMAAMHAANESICADALAEGVKCYKYYIKNHK